MNFTSINYQIEMRAFKVHIEIECTNLDLLDYSTFHGDIHTQRFEIIFAFGHSINFGIV